MKKILLSLAMIAMASSVAVGATKAYFTASDTVPATLAAGKIVLDVTPGQSTVFPMAISNLQPAVWTSPFNVNIYNTSQSTMAVKYRGSSNNFSDDVSGFIGKVWVRAAHNHCGTAGDWTTTPSLVKYEGPLSGLTFNSVTDGISPSLDINITHCWQLSYALASDTGNAYQGAAGAFNFVADATQTVNPGWTE